MTMQNRKVIMCLLIVLCGLRVNSAQSTRTQSQSQSPVAVVAPERAAAIAALKAQNRFFDVTNQESLSKTVYAFTDAAWQGKVEVVNLYLQAGVDINSQNAEFGNTALYAAAEKKHWELAQELLDKGANPRLVNKNGRTPLLSAMQYSQVSESGEYQPSVLRFIRALLERGAEVNATETDTGATPWFAVVEDGNAELVKLFLAHGADANAANREGEPILVRAARKCNAAAARVLLEHGAQSEARLTRKYLGEMYSETPLLATVRECGNASIAKELLAGGSDIEARDHNGKTALMLAAGNAQYETVKTLLAAGAKVNAADNHGNTPLSVASRSDITQLLLKAGAQLDWRQRFFFYGSRFVLWQILLLPLVFIILVIVNAMYGKNIHPPKKRHAVKDGDKLPNLVPLKCNSCGVGVPLKVDIKSCPSCGAPFRIPDDYAQTLTLRAAAAEKLKTAVRAWKRARVLTSFPLRGLLWLAAIGWLAMTLGGVYGLSFFGFARPLTASGDALKFICGTIGALNGLSLAGALGLYAFFVGGTNKLLPRIGNFVGSAEPTNCHLCGGAIKFAAGELATACSYCGSETYRAALTRKARAQAAREHSEVELSIYDSVAEIEARRKEMLEYSAFAVIGVYYLAFRVGVAVILRS